MKALIISAAFPPLKSGGADFVHRLASELASREIDVSIIASNSAVSHDEALHMHRVSQKWNWQANQSCVSIVKKLQPDLVDIVFTGWMYNDHPSITFLPTLIKQSCPGTRVIVHIESLGGIRRDKSNFVRAASRYAASLIAGRENISYEYGTLLRDSDAVITLSERDRVELIKHNTEVGRKSATISPPSIMPVVPKMAEKSRREARTRLGLTGDADLLLSFYGYIYPGKGIEVLFDVLKRLTAHGRNVKLIIVGDVPEMYVLEREGRPDYLEELKRLARELGVYEKVIWSEYARYGSSEPSSKLRLSDICVFPFIGGINQHNSSFWFAAAHGLPIVVTRSATTEDIFVDKENVVFSLPDDASDLTAKIEQLSKDEELKTRIGANAESLANQGFSWQSCIDKTLAIFRRT